MARIAILAGGLPPLHNGGAEIAAFRIAQSAVRLGHDIHVIVPQQSEVVSDGFKVHCIPTVPYRYVRSLFYGLGAMGVLYRLKPGLVHVQGIAMVPAAVLAQKVFGLPYLFYERGGVYLSFASRGFIYRLATKYAARIVAQTEHQKRVLKQFTSKDVEVIPNGIDAARFGRQTKLEAREQLGLPLDKRIVLSVGRCRPEKNVQGFIRAAVRPDAVYVVVGDGPQLRTLKQQANGNVMFAGAVDNDEVPLYMSAADVLVNTSYSEGFPLAILEAMASGLPIVAPRVCGVPEIVIDGVHGLLTDPCDARSTVAAVDAILDDDALAHKLSGANRERAERYNWVNVVRQLYV